MANFFFPRESPVVFRVEGRDATRYLHARLSNDIKKMPPATTCRAAMLTAQGKTEGLFSVISHPEHYYLLIADGGQAEALLPALKRFIVADRVEVRDVSADFRFFHLLGSEQYLSAFGAPSGLSAAAVAKDRVVFWRKRSAQHGLDVLVSSASADLLFEELLATDATQLSPAQEELLRLKGGEPSFPRELNQESLFSESGLSDAVSFSKGCYVGQEVIEKVDAIGRVPRKLFRFKSTADFSQAHERAPVKICDLSGSALGVVLSYAYDQATGEGYGFATLKNITSVASGATIMIENKEGKIL